MKEKDKTEKAFLSYDDVFADIINATFFQGEEVVKEGELKEAREEITFIL